MLQERKFLIHGRTATTITIVLFCLLLAGAVFVCLFNKIAGICIAAVLFIIALYLLWRIPIIIIFSDSIIKTKTFFGKVKKIMYWSDLKKILLKVLLAGGRGSDNYCIFASTEKSFDFQSYEEADQEDQVILMSYRKELKETLKNYTKIDIENMI